MKQQYGDAVERPLLQAGRQEGLTATLGGGTDTSVKLYKKVV